MDPKEAAAWALWNELTEKDLHTPVDELMGVKLVRLSPSTVMTMEMSEKVRGAAPGIVHGGLLATLADTASAVSLWSAYDMAVEIPVTTDMHVRYYRQPRAGPLLAEAAVVHQGRRLLSTECSVVDAEDRVLSRTTATYMLVPLAADAVWRTPQPAE